MDQSLSLLSAQVHFLDTELALIHIPLELYSFFVEAILQLLLPSYSEKAKTLIEPSTETERNRSRQPWAFDHPFVNVSITPVECSIACSRKIANRLFVPVASKLGSTAQGKVVISNEDYIVIQVDGEGDDIAQRVMELTSPLAMNGISIFFVTTYHSDYILVPLRQRSTVISALEQRGFVFEENSEAFVNISSPLMTSSWSGHSLDLSSSVRSSTSSNPFETSFSSMAIENGQTPSTPPPSSINELQSRTFALLARRGIHPAADPSLRLIQCAGRKDEQVGLDGANEQTANDYPTVLAKQLHLGLVRCIVCIPRPRFFSVTLTDTEPASLLIEQRLLAEFEDPNGKPNEEILLGSKQDILIPITLDLRELPMESTGIVCGVASRLVGPRTSDSEDNSTSNSSPAQNGSSSSNQATHVEMSYLSTARAGTVIIAETDLKRTMNALQFEIHPQPQPSPSIGLGVNVS